MKILIIDEEGLSLDFTLRCQAFGHVVRVFISKNKGERPAVGDGLITRVPDWESHMNWADLIFCTNNGKYFHALEEFRDKGFPIVGPSLDTRRWEQDRCFGAEIMEKAGIKTIPSTKFKNYDEAIAYVIKNNKRYVSKPVGDGDKELSYVSKSPADLIFMLQKWKKCNAYKGEFILQEFHAGIEMAVGGWFGPGGFNKEFCENWEFKKLMNGDLGVATGEQGTVVRYTEDSLLADKVLKPLEGFLHGLAFTGYLDVNCIIDKQGFPWPLEFTVRPGWPLFQIQQALHKGDPAQWLLDLLDGKDTLKVRKDVAVGVVISIPPYPYDDAQDKVTHGYPLYGITEEDTLDCIHLSFVKKGKAPMMVDGEVKLNQDCLVTAGSYVCTISGRGATISDAKCKVYDIVKKKVNLPNSPMYRTDIGHRLEDQIDDLHLNGYSLDLEY
jgi:phosphoribosylamine--glycine ligase